MNAILKLSYTLVLTTLIIACNQQNKKEEILQQQIEDLKSQVENTYKPGIGDIMGNIQRHHNKLWFAGVNKNWDLADFAIHEIAESFEFLEKFQGNREEMKTINMIVPSLEKLKKTIKEQNKEEFKEGYTVLSETCNACHSSTGFGFIKIIPPTNPSLSNQKYKPTY